jgi:hypothetical protein
MSIEIVYVFLVVKFIVYLEKMIVVPFFFQKRTLTGNFQILDNVLLSTLKKGLLSFSQRKSNFGDWIHVYLIKGTIIYSFFQTF